MGRGDFPLCSGLKFKLISSMVGEKNASTFGKIMKKYLVSKVYIKLHNDVTK